MTVVRVLKAVYAGSRFWCHCAASFVMNYGQFYFWVLVPLIANEMGAKSSELALLYAVNSIVYAAASVTTGVLNLRRFNTAWTLRVGVVIFVGACGLCMGESAGFWIFYLASAVGAFGSGMFWTIIQTIIGLEAPPDQKTRSLSIFSMSWCIGKSANKTYEPDAPESAESAAAAPAVPVPVPDPSKSPDYHAIPTAGVSSSNDPENSNCSQNPTPRLSTDNRTSTEVNGSARFSVDSRQSSEQKLVPAGTSGTDVELSTISASPSDVDAFPIEKQGRKPSKGGLWKILMWFRVLFTPDEPLPDHDDDRDKSKVYAFQCWLMNFFMNGMMSTIISQFVKLAMDYKISFWPIDEEEHAAAIARNNSTGSSTSSSVSSSSEDEWYRSKVETTIGIFFCVMFVWQSIFFFVLAKLRWGRRRQLVYLAILMAVGGVLLISFVHSAVALLFISALCGVAGGFSILGSLSASVNVCGAFVGINEAVLAFGGSVMPLVAGAVSDGTGDPRAAYWTIAASALVIIGLQEALQYAGFPLLRLLRRRKARKQIELPQQGSEGKSEGSSEGLGDAKTRSPESSTVV
eukprot:m51a1_g4189 hypothetical protein (574) ;mRNA; r:389633-391931